MPKWKNIVVKADLISQALDRRTVGLLPRFVSHLVDALVVLLISSFAMELFFGKNIEALVRVLPPLYLCVWLLYHGLMGSEWSSGQTLGRAFQRTALTNRDGYYLSFRDSLYRAGLELLFLLIPILLVADVIFFFWWKHFTWHDRLCGSRVLAREDESSQYHRVRGMNVAVIVIVVFNFMQLYYEAKPPTANVIGSTDSSVFMAELEEAAQSGDPKSQYTLGMIYYEGKEIPQNAKEAAKWFRLAAEQGNARSQYQLAILHVSGNGVPKDFGKAFKLLKAAADGGDPDAQDALRKLASVR